MIHQVLALFAATEVFIYVFIEIFTQIESVRRVIAQKARWYDTIFFILLFGAFSIFGTYTGIVLPSGAISSIRDLGPLVAGLVAGPLAGLGAGLIGGVHRYFLGGFSCIPCGISTVLAGLIGGIVYLIAKKKFISIFHAMVLAVFVELIHGLIALLLARPFADALDAFYTAIPAMMLANAMGIAISFIILDRVLKEIKAGH
jgi:sigma-B regulation protein RsbU (phosphoserine phosphatase)